jgi:hypothetical protein
VTEFVESEWVDSDQYLGPKMKRITFACEKCGHVWTRTFKAEPKYNPKCPAKACEEKARIADLERQLANLRAMVESGQGPATIGANIRVKAVDETARIVMEDQNLTNLKDNIRQGETMAPKLPPAQQKQADTLFAAAAGANVPVVGRSQGYHRGVPAKWLQHVGARAIAGTYAANSVRPTQVLPPTRPPVVRESNPGYIERKGK